MTRSILGVGLVVTALLAGCSVTTADDVGTTLPPAGAGFDYQLAAPYPAPDGVTVVARDSTADPAAAGYDICYINGFQTQPGESETWLAERAALLLHDADGDPVADPDWPDEYLLDTSNALRRSAILTVLSPAFTACAEAGYQAVEIDNLDSYSRSDDLLSIEGNIALAAAYVELAHSLGLAVAQKNGSSDSVRLRDEAGFDFVVAEQCAEFEECAAYTDAYGELVFDIEYDPDFFAAACEAVPSAVLRDVDLVAPDAEGYVYQACS